MIRGKNRVKLKSSAINHQAIYRSHTQLTSFQLSRFESLDCRDNKIPHTKLSHGDNKKKGRKEKRNDDDMALLIIRDEGDRKEKEIVCAVLHELP